MPEGDTIAYAARRMRPVLEGHVPDEIRTHGKHLFISFSGELTIHSHLSMTGSWSVYPPGRRWGRAARRAWLVLSSGGIEVVQFDGPVLELMSDSRAALPPAGHPGVPSWAPAASSGCLDQRLGGLGPDILADKFDHARFLARLRADDHTRGIGDALLDQRNLAARGCGPLALVARLTGPAPRPPAGNLWKSEGCWAAGIDRWRVVGEISDDEAVTIVEGLRPRMFESARLGNQKAHRRVFRSHGRPCPRCATRIQAHGQGEANRTTFWCPGCQR